MASKLVLSPRTTLLLALNLLFFSLVTCTYCPPPPSPKPKLPPVHKPKSPPPSSPTPKTPTTPKPKTPAPTPKTPASPPKVVPTPPTAATCPRDALKLGACANVLSGLIGVVVGTPSNKDSCCSLLNGLADIDAAVCLCTAIKANVLGLNLNVPVDLSLLLNYCDKKEPTGFKCE